jgi:hypothetical protein
MDFTEGSLFANLIVSAVGFFLLTYGRKTSDIRKVVLGMVMLVYPYFVSNAAVMIGIAVALVGGFWLFDTYV